MYPQLPAGLLDENIEFFCSPDLNAFCLSSGKRLQFEEFGEEIYQIVEKEIARNPVKRACLRAMGLTNRLAIIKQFLICNYGGFDLSPDIKNGKLATTEYWACPKRGTCPYEGMLCDSLSTDTGHYLTAREIEVLKLIAFGDIDKIIADKLHIALSTVTTHNRNIRLKTGLFRKSDLTRFAIQKQLI